MIPLEKIGIYISLLISFLVLIFYIIEDKERIARLEIEVENLIDSRSFTTFK